MSNRLFALLVLIIVFGFGGGFIYYFFFANAGNLEVKVGDIDGVQIELNSEYNAKLPAFICNKICNLSNVPPIKYTLIATKEGYKEIAKDIKINRGELLNISLNLEKEISLNEPKNENKDKIGVIKYSKLLEQKEDLIASGTEQGEKIILGFVNNTLYYYKYDPNFTIYLFDSEKEKKEFSLSTSEIKNVIFNKNDLFVIIKSNNNSVFDIKTGINYIINIDENILYVKKTISADKLIVTTDKGTYLYDLQNNSGVKNTLFNDFVVLEEGKILGLINKNDKQKTSLLNFTDDNKDKLVLHVVNTRDKTIIYETDKNISYMELVNGEIILTDIDDNKFEVAELKW